MNEGERKFEEGCAENMMSSLREAFKDEAYELIAELESALLELEKAPDNGELIGRVFRAMHTIKGSGAACGLNDVAAFTHEIETFFEMVRKGKISVTKEIIDLTLKARDQIKAMLDQYYKGGSADALIAQEIATSFKDLLPSTGERHTAISHSSRRLQNEKTSSSQVEPRKSATYRIRFRPAQDILTRGVNPISLLDELRRLGKCKVVAQTDSVPDLEDFNPELCYTYWDAILTTHQGLDAIKDTFIFVKDSSELKIDLIDDDGRLDDEKSYKKLSDILVERGDVKPEEIKLALTQQRRIGEILVDAGVVDKSKVESALAEQEHLREIREKKQKEESTLSVRVSAAKLDRLVDLVGELVTVQARLSQTAITEQQPTLLSVSEEVERLVSELRDHVMSIRMLPIGTIFSKLQRVVRDLSKDLGKEIELVTEGAETELDKTVIERLNDPLVHLIRNSIDHGIETPVARERIGKPRRGVITLSAKQTGGNVFLSTTDDGKGLDCEAIRAKAVEKGMIVPDALISEQELISLILAPGFTTTKQVTSVSGRGVGLDVVKQAMDGLRGTISIESRTNKGTTITLKLPLTLAIIDGFLTRIGNNTYVFPLSMVEECVELKRSDAENIHGRNIENVRGEIVPFVRLREHFLIGGSRPAIEQIVITRVENNRVGFVVDQILGGHQTVIKNLGKFYKKVEGVSGATILGDGTVALILDVPKLVQSAEAEGIRTRS